MELLETQLPPSLPPGVVSCEGFGRSTWITKAVTLTNETRQDVAKVICHSVDASLIVNMDGRPLGDDRVAVQIAESLLESDVPSTWAWSMHSWHISRVFFNGASLYDHEKTNLYNAALNAIRRQICARVRPYESRRERREPSFPPKKDQLISSHALNEVSSRICCSMGCLQPFPRSKILAIQTQIYIEGGTYFRKHRLLDVHRQIHKDNDGKDKITLEEIEVCPIAWWTIHGISKATLYRYREKTNSGERAQHHGNLGSKKPRTQTLQATATLRTLLESSADQMPHKSRTMESGEKVVSMCLPSSFRWCETLPEINGVNAQFNLPNVSLSGLSRIRRDSFLEYVPKSRGDSFARCGVCDRLKQLRIACTPGSRAQTLWMNKLKVHLVGQRAHRELYYGNWRLSETFPEKILIVIHDKMDHSKTSSPHFSHKSKATDFFMKLPVAVTGMIAHGHADVWYAHYGLDVFPSDSNHTVGSIAQMLRNVESEPKSSSRQFFFGSGSSELSKAVLEGSEMCIASLLPPSAVSVEAQPLPPTLTLQLDNCCGDNKNRWVFAFCSLLVYKCIFREIYINFLILRHTHEDIDALFGRWSNKLKTNDYPTLPKLMKSFMDSENLPVIPHLIEEVPNFKAFVDGYLCSGIDSLEGHTNAQQFKFYKDSSGWPLIQYKHLCTDVDWLPSEGGGIHLWKETVDGCPKVLSGEPTTLAPQQMRNFEKVCKGIDGYIALRATMSNEDISGEFKRLNEPLSRYWQGLRNALNSLIVVQHSLKNDFWPSSRYEIEVEDQFLDDGALCEEYVEDAPFVGRRRDRPPPSFRVGRDIYAGYFVAMRPADDDLRPFWLARAISNPNPDPGHMNSIQIQYWTPCSSPHIDMRTYAGWDSKEGNLWCEDSYFSSNRCDTNCIMTGWKPCIRLGTTNPKVKIPKTQMTIIKASMEAYTLE